MIKQDGGYGETYIFYVMPGKNMIWGKLDIYYLQSTAKWKKCSNWTRTDIFETAIGVASFKVQTILKMTLGKWVICIWIGYDGDKYYNLQGWIKW